MKITAVSHHHYLSCLSALQFKSGYYGNVSGVLRNAGDFSNQDTIAFPERQNQIPLRGGLAVKDKNEINIVKVESIFDRFHSGEVAKLLGIGEAVRPLSVMLKV